MADKRMEQWVQWEPCEGGEAGRALSRLAATRPEFFGAATLDSARCSRLSFYAHHRLMELYFTRETGRERAFALVSAGESLWLDGTSGPIHDVNDLESLELGEKTVLDYI